MALNKSRIYTDAAASLSTADDAQTDAYMYNFGMLRVVEYLAGYRAVTIQSIPGAPASRNVSIKVPVWLKLNSEVIGSIRSGLLCRIRKYNDPTANIGSYEMFDSLPVIGEHFLLTVTPGAPVRSARVTRNSSATLNAESLTYPSAPFLRSAERENFLNLLRLESDRTILEERVEYTLSEPPQPATNTRGQTSSVPGAREVRRIVPPPRQSRIASAAPIMTSPVGVAQGNTPPVSPPQGNNGGHAAPPAGGGGGGGATQAGAAGSNDGNEKGGVGGAGGTTEITGSSVAYAGGGGGSGYANGAVTQAPGGIGGGGSGSYCVSVSGAGSSGTANTGGGGGGGKGHPGPSENVQTGGGGGKGIVIIRYRYQ